MKLKGRFSCKATKGYGGVDVAHGGLDVFPAYIGHQGLEIPAICRGPGGEASA